MKLDIGDAGQLLAKSKIDTDTITIDLYTSNETVLTRVADTLPFLERRLADLGLNVEKMSFQLEPLCCVDGSLIRFLN